MKNQKVYLSLMKLFYLFILFAFTSFYPHKEEKPYVIILGIAQDAGYPQIRCRKECCKKVYDGKAGKQMVSSIAIVDPVSRQKWIIDATPDLSEQLKMLDEDQSGDLTGIFLTHAHIGHYTGLMYLGREAMNANRMPVYAMPRMTDFINSNGPWSQLVTLNNIELRKLKTDSIIQLNERISIQPLLVPHRDEFSETVGYLVRSMDQRILYIPDIDKWNKWRKGLSFYVAYCTYLLLDGTFNKEGELPGRNMAEIPHPFVEETMKVLEGFDVVDKRKIWFTHFNHTNPLIREDSDESKEVRDKGFNLARQGHIFKL